MVSSPTVPDQTRRVVLIGAGHAHVMLARRAERLREAGLECLMVSPDGFWYSGLATGMLGGRYEPAMDRLDAGRLIESHGGRFARDRVAHLDPLAQRVTLASGQVLGYDAISFNLGSRSSTGGIEGVEHAWPIKPIHKLAELRRRLIERFQSGGESGPVRLVVVGGGPSGCEIAANLTALARRCRAETRVTILSRSTRLLARHRRKAGGVVEAALRARSVRIVTRCSVARIHPEGVDTRDGERFAADAVVLATGLRPPRIVSELGLPMDQEGAMEVDECLRAVGYEHVFGVGDCIRFAGCDLPNLGVFSVRQSPVLEHNLRTLVTGESLRRYRPQPRHLEILNLGAGEGLGLWGPLHWRGRSMLWLKERLDLGFMRRHRPDEPG